MRIPGPSNRQHRDDLLNRVRYAIASSGFGVIKIPNILPGINMSHTAGMTEYNLPEMIMTGVLHCSAMESAINSAAAKWAQLGPEQREALMGIHEDVIALQDGTPARVLIREVDTRNLGDFRPRVLRDLYSNLGRPYRLVQVLWPDDNGVLPTEEGYDHAQRPQPLLPVKE